MELDGRITDPTKLEGTAKGIAVLSGQIAWEEGSRIAKILALTPGCNTVRYRSCFGDFLAE